MAQSLEKVDDQIQLPDIGLLKKRYEAIQQIKKEILGEDDFVEIGKGENKVKATRKSGWLKYAVAFGLSVKIIGERKEVNPTDPTKYAYHITIQCIAPGGRITEAVGTCTIGERSTWNTEHIVRAMADTRGTERAIIKMLGTNEIPADDLNDKEEESQVKYCTCKDGPKTQLNGKCKDCGNYSEVWYKQTHASDTK